jgi:hypothetical protein
MVGKRPKEEMMNEPSSEPACKSSLASFALASTRSFIPSVSPLFTPSSQADYPQFKGQVKELDRRLASLIALAFDDRATVTGRFKLLDAFEGLLDRGIIQDELEVWRKSR